jgi:signal transduction histidine kinase
MNIVVTISPLLNEAGEVIAALSVARNVTEDRQTARSLSQLEAQMRSRAVVLDTANRVALDILAQRSGVEALRHIAEAAQALVGAKYAAIGVASKRGQGLEEFVTVGIDQKEEAGIDHRPAGIGILGLLLDRSEPLRIDSLGKHAASSGFPAGHPPMTTFLGVPISRGETVIGSLYLTDKFDGGPFTDEDEAAVAALGSYAAVAIHNLHMQHQQQSLVRGLIHAQEEERRTVAYDLHDGLTQYIMASHAHLESFRRAKLGGNVPKADRELDQGMLLLTKAVVESRRMINGLRTLALDDLGLAGALEQLLDDEKIRSNWSEADLIHNIEGRRFDKTLETAVYRVAQEALTNAHKHANSKKVRLQLLLKARGPTGVPQLILDVRDWGKGFDQDQHKDGYDHLGLHSMVERVDILSGTIKITSVVGVGTTVNAVFPVIEMPLMTRKEGSE